MAKLYTAAYEVYLTVGGVEVLPTGEYHPFYIYDPDGDPTSGDELVFRGGPIEGAAGSGSDIYIEMWTDVNKSQKSYMGFYWWFFCLYSYVSDFVDHSSKGKITIMVSCWGAKCVGVISYFNVCGTILNV